MDIKDIVTESMAAEGHKCEAAPASRPDWAKEFSPKWRALVSRPLRGRRPAARATHQKDRNRRTQCTNLRLCQTAPHSYRRRRTWVKAS